MDKEKDYNNLHIALVLKYFWRVVRRFKKSFFSAVIGTFIAPLLIYIYLFSFLNSGIF